MPTVGGMLQLGDRSLHSRKRQFSQRNKAVRSDIVEFLSQIVVVRPYAVFLQLGIHSHHESLSTNPGRVGKEYLSRDAVAVHCSHPPVRRVDYRRYVAPMRGQAFSVGNHPMTQGNPSVHHHSAVAHPVLPAIFLHDLWYAVTPFRFGHPAGPGVRFLLAVTVSVDALVFESHDLSLLMQPNL